MILSLTFKVQYELTMTSQGEVIFSMLEFFSFSDLLLYIWLQGTKVYFIIRLNPRAGKVKRICCPGGNAGPSCSGFPALVPQEKVLFSAL